MCDFRGYIISKTWERFSLSSPSFNSFFFTFPRSQLVFSRNVRNCESGLFSRVLPAEYPFIINRETNTRTQSTPFVAEHHRVARHSVCSLEFLAAFIVPLCSIFQQDRF